MVSLSMTARKLAPAGYSLVSVQGVELGQQRGVSSTIGEGADAPMMRPRFCQFTFARYSSEVPAQYTRAYDITVNTCVPASRESGNLPYRPPCAHASGRRPGLPRRPSSRVLWLGSSLPRRKSWRWFDGQHVKWRLKMLRSEDASSPHDDVELRCGHDDLLLLLW